MPKALGKIPKMTHSNAILLLAQAGHFSFGGLMFICFVAGLVLALMSKR